MKKTNKASETRLTSSIPTHVKRGPQKKRDRGQKMYV